MDPSAFAPFNLGEIMARGQEAQLRRLQLQNERMRMEDSRAEREVYGKIFSGGMSADGRPDRQTLGDLARINPEAAMKVNQYFNSLGEQDRKLEEGKWKAAAPLLVQMQQMPYESRRQFMMSAAPVLTANGWRPEEIAGFDPTDQNVKALSSAAMTVEQVISGNTLKWNQIGENGSFATDQFGNPVGSGNPFAPGAAKPQASGGNPSGNNNPGALRVPGSMQFQSFSTPQQGIAAQGALLNRYMGSGLNNVSSIIEKYAPRKSRGGDNTDEQVNNYIDYVSRQLNVNPKDALSPAVIPRLASAMREFETGHRSSYSSAPRRISSREAFNALPSGTHFIAPDGSERVKP